MMHFFRRAKIHLDTFTWRRDVIEYAPIVNGIEAIPKWWRDLPKQVTNANDGFSPSATMKTCVGMYDYYARSIAMPLWSDLCVAVEAGGAYSWQFSDTYTKALVHAKQQYTGFLEADLYGHLKVESPWLFTTKEDITWMLTAPVYNAKAIRDFALAQGVLNFSKQNGTNLQLFVDIATIRSYVIPFGTPFLFTPLSDKKVVVHRHLISKEEHASKGALSTPITFINKYRNQQKARKCPYKDLIK